MRCLSQPTDARKETPRIKVRLVWRLVLGLLVHLALLLVLAIYLVISLNSVVSYTPIVRAAGTEMASLNTLPALLRAMDAERRSYQRATDSRDLAIYNQTRRQVENNLASLNSPFLLASPSELERRKLVHQWIQEVGSATVDHPEINPLALGQLDARSTELLKQLDVVTDTVRREIETTLTSLQQEEANEAKSRVDMMWIGVGTVIVITIILQWLVSNSIISPIQMLAAAVRRLQGGDYTVRTRIHSGDELESLGETFNAMAANILRTQRELEEKNERLSAQQEALRGANLGLEERVAEKTRELEDKNQKLREAARLKDEFLATLSHELRTPLTPVISCAHLLGTDPQLGPEQLRNVNVIDRNARALSRMIDELLDLSAVMNRKLRLARERVEMNEWTHLTIETMRPAWRKKELEMTFIPSTEPVKLEIDPARLAQVLTNLINNAIKFTEPGGKITVRLTADENEVRIAVTDNGVGLKRSEINKIFEMFHQARRQRTGNTGGLGVGLTVARSLAELHGGRLMAESSGPGRGATFTLWLPRQAPSAADPPPQPATKPVADLLPLKEKRILLVEDAPDTREALQRIYQRRGCDVITASSAEEALELAERVRPDIIISDIGLPKLSGLDLMSRLRTRPEFHGVVAIALSGLGRDQDIQASREAGFDAHLLKPVELNVLDQTLIDTLQKRMKFTGKSTEK
ncbi:MAG TPA: ATP-binding protein [Candidatus Methylacidiphilales bacterium]|nr:ATP-binding protein [Candidatus Methylacidiphilales bacterium]